MAERTRRPGALAVLCSCCLVVAGAVVWDVQSTQSEAVGHWLSITLVMAGLLLLYVASSKVRGEFEEEWTELQPSDGRRGADASGWTSGQTDSDLGQGRRRDAMASSETYDGLEGPLRPSELLRAEANERYDEVAAARWAASEANDPDLKEAGFERLGDLVAANSLTGPGPEDTFRHLSQAQEPEEP
ncbi:MAG: hypothetical protein ACPF92_05405 [Candidatus Poseidoniaceae archaeon]